MSIRQFIYQKGSKFVAVWGISQGYGHTRIEKRGCLNVARAPPQNDWDHFWVSASYPV